MKIITYEQFVEDYNKHFNTDYRVVITNTLEIDSILDEVYDNADWEINDEEETIALY